MVDIQKGVFASCVTPGVQEEALKHFIEVRIKSHFDALLNK